MPQITEASVVGTVTSDSELPTAIVLADGATTPTSPLVGSATEFYNGATWDLARGNISVVLLASAGRTTTQTSADITNFNGSGLHLILDVTTAGTGSITAKVDAKDANGVYYNLLTGAAVTTISTNVYRIGPSLTAAANAVANDFVPRTFRVTITANNANSMTYSAAYAISRR